MPTSSSVTTPTLFKHSSIFTSSGMPDISQLLRSTLDNLSNGSVICSTILSKSSAEVTDDDGDDFDSRFESNELNFINDDCKRSNTARALLKRDTRLSERCNNVGNVFFTPFTTGIGGGGERTIDELRIVVFGNVSGFDL
ncbi:hypothetical protein DERP_012399 [Dermatophagoides pteronyssinus]|uniref:Uncharacterized protein n=1 Tax=Dermatophagoides pteronyssinus TaxID=6956 RepID=A0ABQ8IUM1_DERPT|nr:hypothetical protein DERP_012399 [Dermatophagoides pteronyssinus]